ncbi:MAG TPA: ATP phosphoribosyltransferase [Armatimonadota bacterium]|nr:ATP phosphoribosyltransferase [Armatimonadota bacterium]
MSSPTLKIALPKGSLQESTYRLFAHAGWKISSSSRSYFPRMDDPELEAILIRAQEIARYVEDGVMDCGLTGRDWVMENEADVVEVCALVYAKQEARPVRWVVAVPDASAITTVQDLQGKRIATELVGATKRFLAQHGVTAHVEFSWGATEAKVPTLVDAIVDVTETGSSLRANNLRILCDVIESVTVLVANKDSWEDPWKRRKMAQLAMLLQGALRADGMVGLKMNVPKTKLKQVIALLPSLNAPTVSSLYQQDWMSVETVISEFTVRELIPQLRKCGAEGIIEYSLNKVI